MKLFEIIKHLKSWNSTEILMSAEMPDVEADMVDIYLVENLDIKSEVKFFNADETPGTLIFELDGVKYINLFPLHQTQEMVESYSNLTDIRLSDIEIAQRILDYRIKDA